MKWFLQMLNARKAAAIDAAKALPGISGAVNLTQISFSAAEPQVYGKTTAQFSMTFMVVLTLQDAGLGAFYSGGLWTPVPNSNWQLWQQSLSKSAFNQRGNANLIFNPADDVIIDLCLVKNPPQASSQTALKGANFGKPAANKLLADQPDPNVSWLRYTNAIYLEYVDNIVEQKPLSSTTVVNPPAQPGGIGKFGDQTGFKPIVIPNMPNSILHQRGNPSFYVVMIGEAVRVGFEIPAPQLVSVGGLQAFPANRRGDGFVQAIIGNNGQPIYGARWQLRYILPNVPPQVISPPPNPYFDPQDNGTALKSR
jgi:hypothetical protein